MRNYTLGRKLCYWRESQKLTQGELGKNLGVDRSTISKWERGYHPSFEHAFRLEHRTKGVIKAKFWLSDKAS